MLESFSAYNAIFYFGIFLLAVALVTFAWRSTYVHGQQNITVFVLQQTSGQQTFHRWRTEESNGPPGEEEEQQADTVDDASEGDINELDDNSVLEDLADVVEDAINASSLDNEYSNDYTLSVPDINDGFTTLLSLTSAVSTSDRSNHRPVSETTASTSQSEIHSDLLTSNPPRAPNMQEMADVSEASTEPSGRPKHPNENSHQVASNSLSESRCSVNENTFSVDSLQDNSIDTLEPCKLSSSAPASDSETASNAAGNVVIAAAVGATVEECQTDSLRGATASEQSAAEASPAASHATTPVDQNETSQAPVATSTGTSNTSKDQKPINCPDGSIRVRLKFLDDRQKTVLGKLTQNVICFKRNHFDVELSENRVVRLIFNGRLLKQDNSTLAQYGLFDNCVLHCHVSQPKNPPPPAPSPTAQPQTPQSPTRRWLQFFWHSNDAAADSEDSNEGLDLSNYVGALLWVIVAILWLIRFKHSYMFSTFSTFMLIFLTMLLVVPHYIFSVDVQLNVNLDGTTMRNLGIDRVVLLQRQLGNDAAATEGGGGGGSSTDGDSSGGTGNDSNSGDSTRQPHTVNAATSTHDSSPGADEEAAAAAAPLSGDEAEEKNKSAEEGAMERNVTDVGGVRRRTVQQQ